MITATSIFFPMALEAKGPIVIEEIKIEGKKVKEEKASSSPSFVTVISEEELETGFNTIGEVISESVGVRVNRFGGLGDYSTISIRGSASEEVLIYLDGVLLNQAQGGGVNLGILPFSHIEEIQIYRGSSSMMFGQAGIGGLVSIQTKRPGEGKLTSGQMQYGSYNTVRLNLLFSDRPGRWGYFVGLDYSRSDNDFEFLDDNGTQYNNSDDKVVKRENNDFRSFNVIAKLEYDLSPKTDIQLHDNFLKYYKGVPGIGSFQSFNANINSWENRVAFQIDHKRTGGINLDIGLAYHHRFLVEAFQDLDGEIGLGRQDNENETESHEGKVMLEYLLGSYQIVNGLFSLRAERFTPTDRLQDTREGSRRRQTLSLGLEDRISPWEGALLVVPSLLVQVINNDFQGETLIAKFNQDETAPDRDAFMTWQIGTLYQINDQLEVRANIGQFYRVPNFYELFGDRGGVIGNPNLLPEEGLNRDIGLKYKVQIEGVIRKANLGLAYFNNRIENMIIFIQNSQRTSRPDNIGRAEIAGLEMSIGLSLRLPITFNGNYTFQRAVNQSDIPSRKGKILPGRPVHELSGKVVYLWSVGSFFYSHDFTALNYLDVANQYTTHSRSIHDVGLSLNLLEPILITLEVKNLTDNRIEDIFGYPLPGRSYFITAKSHF